MTSAFPLPRHRMRRCCARDADGIAVLTLNRPEARNSLSEALLRALTSN